MQLVEYPIMAGGAPAPWPGKDAGGNIPVVNGFRASPGVLKLSGILVGKKAFSRACASFAWLMPLGRWT
jgi:hypothetical protein